MKNLVAVFLWPDWTSVSYLIMTLWRSSLIMLLILKANINYKNAVFYHYYFFLSTPHIFGLFLSLIKYVPFIGMFSTCSFLFLPKGQIQIPSLFWGLFPLEKRLFLLPPLIFFSTYELFDDWHLLTCIVILMCISKS